MNGAFAPVDEINLNEKEKDEIDATEYVAPVLDVLECENGVLTPSVPVFNKNEENEEKEENDFVFVFTMKHSLYFVPKLK